MSVPSTISQKDLEGIVQGYYDSSDAFLFYTQLWGGLHIHVGIYNDEDTVGDKALVSEATVRSTEELLRHLASVQPLKLVADLGSGIGGTGRQLCTMNGDVHVDCFDLSSRECGINESRNKESGFESRISVFVQSYLDTAKPDGYYDAVIAQDAFLHCSSKEGIFKEAARLLRPGGRLIFSDLLQIDECITPADKDFMESIYNRLSLNSLGSVSSYLAVAAEVGLKKVSVTEYGSSMKKHYASVKCILENEGPSIGISETYINKMGNGLSAWVSGVERGILSWGIFVFEKPDSKQ